jgi:hypothetical protein
MRRAFIDGRYVVERLLGSGGMAQVYLAHDEVLGRHVALKILGDQYAEDEEFVERFKREARSAASLSHPNIVSIYDQGRSEDGAYYMAMEYVPGGTLKERIRREGALSPGAAVGVALQVTDALSEAHERGVIHRDIKPQNVLVTEKGDVKVTDFGIARAVASASSGATATGVVLGTADYMSPEQSRAEPVGPQSDLYSLGVVLYEMLTGTLPYEAQSPMGVAMKHATEPVRSPREVNPSVPEPLAVLTTRLLAKDPEDRYASAAALSEGLERVRSGLSPVAADAQKAETVTVPLPPLPPDGGERTKRTAVQPPSVAAPPGVPGGPRRGRGRLLAELFALLVVVILLGGLVWVLARGTDDRSGAEDAQGSRMVRVPDLVYAETAESDLATAGLRLGRRDEAASDTAPVGVVAEQDPAEGTEAEEGSAVDIVVSTGPRQVPVDKKQAQEEGKQGERQRQEEEKQREKQQQEAEKQREKQQQEAEKQKEKQQQEEEKRREKGE